MGFTRVLLGFTRFHRVLLRMNGFGQVLTGFSWMKLGSMELRPTRMLRSASTVGTERRDFATAAVYLVEHLLHFQIFTTAITIVVVFPWPLF